MHSRFFYWFFSLLFFVYASMVPTILNTLLDQHALTHGTAFHFKYYYLIFICTHVPAGVALDKYGAEKILPLAAILSTFGLLPLYFTQVINPLILTQFVMGIGTSVAILGVVKIICQYFEENQGALLLGISLMGGILAPFCAQYLLRAPQNDLILFLLILGLFMAISLWMSAPITVNNQNILIPENNVFANLSRIVPVCILACCAIGPLYSFITLEGTSFLNMKPFLSYAFMGYIVGPVFLGYLAKITRSYYFVLTLCALALCLCSVSLIFLTLNVYSLRMVFICIGLFSSYPMLAVLKACMNVPHASGLVCALGHNILTLTTFAFTHQQLHLHPSFSSTLMAILFGSLAGSLGFLVLSFIHHYKTSVYQAAEIQWLSSDFEELKRLAS